MSPTTAPITRLNLKLLQTFVLVAERSSFREAARLAHRSQSAITTQIKQLEGQLGIVLFHRTTRHVSLTDEGKELFAGARRAMDELQLSLRKVQEAADTHRGQVSLACAPSVAASGLPRVLSAFEKDYPKVQVTLRELPAGVTVEAVRNGEVDFAVGPVVEGNDDLGFDVVLTHTLLALVPAAVAKTRKAVTLKELATMPLLLLHGAHGTRQLIDAAMREHALRFDAKYQCIQSQTLVAMAEAGLGVAILPESIARSARIAATRALPITEPALSRQIAIITRRGRPLLPAAARLVQLIREMLVANDRRAHRKAAAGTTKKARPRR